MLATVGIDATGVFIRRPQAGVKKTAIPILIAV